MVGKSGQNSVEFRRISDSGPIFDPIFPIPIPLPNGKGIPATNFSKFLRDFPTKITRILEAEAEIPIPDPPGRGAIPAEFTTKGDRGGGITLVATTELPAFVRLEM